MKRAAVEAQQAKRRYLLGRLIALEPKQADLLQRICAGPLRKADELQEAGARARRTHIGKGKRQEQKEGLSGRRQLRAQAAQLRFEFMRELARLEAA